MKLWLCTLLALLELLRGCCGRIAFSNDPEKEALSLVFRSDEEKHPGPNRLRWHIADLKEAVRILQTLNMVKSRHEKKTYFGYMKGIEDTRKMIDIIVELNHLASKSGLTYDFHAGDPFLWEKIAKYVERHKFTKWLNKHFNKWGPGFFKYIVMSDDYDYNITDPAQFVEAMYTPHIDPPELAARFGMSLMQLKQLNLAIENAVLPEPEYWQQALLIGVINKEMCGLGLTDCSTVLNSMFGLHSLKPSA